MDILPADWLYCICTPALRITRFGNLDNQNINQ